MDQGKRYYKVKTPLGVAPGPQGASLGHVTTSLVGHSIAIPSSPCKPRRKPNH
uniref:Uncharacterized protein n=1 Tax=Arion vulgaris TaxID=1028688 RepID=A0A0B7B5Y8_9EUPU